MLAELRRPLVQLQAAPTTTPVHTDRGKEGEEEKEMGKKGRWRKEGGDGVRRKEGKGDG